MKSPSLDAAFRATSYCVALPGGEFELRIGRNEPALTRWLAAAGATCWGIVTAENPGAKRIDATDAGDADNAAQTEAMRRTLDEAGMRHYPTRHRADAGDWPEERGFFILDASEAQLWQWARRFGQAAFVAGSATGAPRLVWTDDAGGRAG